MVKRADDKAAEGGDGKTLQQAVHKKAESLQDFGASEKATLSKRLREQATRPTASWELRGHLHASISDANREAALR